MARGRLVRPEFWWDERVDELTDTEALAFIALWNHVDDEGRHRYKPRELEMKMPRFNGRWPEFLKRFEEMEFIRVYEVGANTYFHVRTWHRWQRINRPTLSDLPAPPDDPIREQAMASRGASVPLTEGVPYEAILELWNQAMGKWCPCVKFDPKDRLLATIRSTWLSHQERQDLTWWKELFVYMSRSAFLRGEKISFVARLEWTLNPDNLRKITSGNYHDEDKKQKIARRFAESGKSRDK